MSIADDIRAAAFSFKPTDIEDVLCSVLMTDAELMMKAWPGEQYRTFMLIVAESFDDREARERMEAARTHAAREASQWAAEARGQRSTVLEILRYFGLPEHDWEALRLIKAKLESDTPAGVRAPRPAGAALDAPKLPTAGLYHFPNDGQLWRTSPLTGVPDRAEGLYTAEQIRAILANHSGVKGLGE